MEVGSLAFQELQANLIYDVFIVILGLQARRMYVTHV